MRDPLTEGFSHFVTSMTAPVASGWSICRVGLAPTGKRRLVTAHTQLGHWPDQSQCPRLAERRPSGSEQAMRHSGRHRAVWSRP